MTRGVRVIKLGGSLLDLPELADDFRRWLAREPAAENVVVVGGGAIVDALRRLEDHLSPEAAHWLSIRAMSLTAAMFAELLSEATLVPTVAEVRREPSATVQIVQVESLLRDDALGHDPLPCAWSVTSDSIAARVAKALAAAELVLLKSTLPVGAPTCESLAQSGFVDAYFPHAAAGLTVRCVNLRDREFPAIVIPE